METSAFNSGNVRTSDPPMLIHRDYHQGNTLWQGPVLHGIVDWDRASWGSRAVDLARMRQNLAEAFGMPARDEFTAAYRSLSGDLVADLGYWDIVDTLDSVPEIDPSDSRLYVALEEHLERALREYEP